jgi:hypothetical protein
MRRRRFTLAGALGAWPGLRRRRPRRCGASRAGAARGPTGPARPSSPGAAPAVAAHPGPEPPGAWLARPGLHHRHLRRRGASRAGAARCPAGAAGAPSRRIPGGWPGPAFVAAAPAVAAHPGPEPPGARPVRPGGGRLAWRPLVPARLRPARDPAGGGRGQGRRSDRAAPSQRRGRRGAVGLTGPARRSARDTAADCNKRGINSSS